MVAGGGGTYAYQWQYSPDGTTWSNVATGGTAATLTFTASASQNGYLYHCQVTNGCGPNAATSAPATLSVCTPAKVLSQPGNANVNVSDTAMFTASASGTAPAYQWQRSPDGTTWANVTAGIGGTTPTYKFVTAGTDNGAKFRVMVTNGCGKDSSQAVTLTVCTPPVISIEPKNDSVIAGSPASFTVTATGTSLAYQWQRSPDGNVWTPIAGATASSYLDTPQAADNGARFECSITSACGTALSTVALLTVCVPVKVTAQHVGAQSVLTGTQVTFSMTAQGTGVGYQWQRSADGATFTPIAGATGDSLTFAAAKTDSGSTFRCVVSGQCGAAITGNTGLVQVFTPVKALFGATPASGVAPLVVSFTDSSKGDFTRRIWTFGDGSADSNFAANKTLSHTFTAPATDTVKLVVSGPGGTDSVWMQVFAYTLGSDPIQISGAYLTPQKVAITLSGYGTITPPSASVSVDSVGLWYKVGALPTAPAQSTFIKWYDLAALHARGSVYADTLTLPALSMPDSVYGIMNGILWSDMTVSNFLTGNGARVLMRDTMPIPNNLVISGSYVPDDTALVSLANANNIDTTRIDTVGIWYSLTGDTTPNFTDKNFTVWLSARSVAQAGVNYTYPIVNTQFNNVQTTITAAVVLVGDNGRHSPVKQVQFTVGKKRPANPILLSARALSSNSIRLTWNNISAAGVDRIIIRYRANTPVPRVYDFSTLGLDSLAPSVADTTIVGANFSGTTRYYFGAQVYKGGLWSYVTDSSSATDSTPQAGAPLPTNSIVIRSLAFNTSTDQIKVCWALNQKQSDSLQVGILYSSDTMPKGNTGAQQVVPVTDSLGCAYVTLHENLIFGKTYYVSLWLRAPTLGWTPPTAQSMDSVAVPTFKWQSVLLFSKDYDTVFAFNTQLRFANQPNDPSRVVDTVLAQAVTPAGFIPVSIAFSFKTNYVGVPFNVGLKIDSIPKGYTRSDIRIFQLDSSGMWIIDTGAVSIDTVGGYVSVLTNQIRFPFMAGIDTTRPTVHPLTNLTAPVPASVAIVDSFSLSDNIANLRWRFMSSKGGESYQVGDTTSGMLSSTAATVSVTIPGALVSPDNGVRGLFIVTDGTFTDTIDVSRRVVDSSLGLVWTEDKKWVPMSVTADLDSPQATTVLRSLVPSGTAWKYDITTFRIFRWSPTTTNAVVGGTWIEYSDSGKQFFDFDRGNLIWIKTKTKTPIQFGSGVTPSLTQPFFINLPPKQFTDFALPFNFNITVADMYAATRDSLKAKGTDTLAADSLILFAWGQDKTTGRYTSNIMYQITIDNAQLNNGAQPLVPGELSGYTMYNPDGSAVKLVIPSLPQAMSLSKKLAKKAAAQGWSVSVVSGLSDGSSLPTVYCGYTKANAPGVTYYPAGPSFADASLGVFDNDTKQVFGLAVAHSVSEGGCSFLLAFCNDAQDKQTIRYHLGDVTLLPKDMKAAVYDDATGRFQDLSKGDTSVALGGNSKSFRWLFVGTQAYIAKAAASVRPAVLKLLGTYPNPFRSMVHIRYGLPYDGIDRLKFAIYDMRGKTVWQTEIRNVTAYGANELLWNGRATDGRPVAAGVYVLQMAAFGNQKAAGVFEKKMTFMP